MKKSEIQSAKKTCLSRKITSSHSLCGEGYLEELAGDGGVIQNEEHKRLFVVGMEHFLSREFDKAFDCFECCQEDYLPAKYQLAVMYYDGLGKDIDHVSTFVICKTTLS